MSKMGAGLGKISMSATASLGPIKQPNAKSEKAKSEKSTKG